MSDMRTDARRLAELAGWFYMERLERSVSCFVADGEFVVVPFPDAPLSAQLTFVGRIAEALGMNRLECLSWSAAVCAEAAALLPGDLSHAAIRAAIAALEARS